MTEFIETLKLLTLPELLDSLTGAGYQYGKSPKHKTYEQIEAIKGEILRRFEYQ